MCDELRALRLTLQAMPVAEPPENLAERILRQAERRMLSGDQALADIPGAAAAIPSVAAPQVFRNWRVALAVVATLSRVRAGDALAPVAYRAGCGAGPAGSAVPGSAVPGSAVPAAPSLAAPSAPAMDDEFAKGAVAESAEGTASFAVKAETTPAPIESASMARRAEMPPPSAPAQDSLANRAVDADSARSPRPEMAQSGGMTGAGGLRESGQPAAGRAGRGDTMGYPGMAGGAGFGASGQPAAGVDRPNEPMGPGMGPGTGGGMGGGLGRDAHPAADTANGAGAMGIPGAGAMGGRGMARGMAPGSMDLGSGMPLGAAGVPPGDSATSAGTDVRKEKMSLSLQYGAPANEQLIDQLISQLDQDQMLLVKVHVPQGELLGSLDELRKSNCVDVLATDESVKALPEGTALPEGMLQSLVVAGASIRAVPSMAELREQLGRASQNVLVVNGSADQIRQTLTNLAAQPGVAIELAPAELNAIRNRSGRKSPSAGLRDRTAVDADHVVRGKGQSFGEGQETTKSDEAAKQEAQQRQEEMPHSGDSQAPLARVVDSPERPADKKSEGTAKPAQSSSEGAGAEPAGETRGQRLAPAAKESKDVAKNMTMIYIYFRLRSDTTPPAPAAKPDNR